MTDIELLELAAKAQGWIDYPDDSIERGDTWHIEPDKAPFGKIVKKSSWNPLTDDGDALRLAVKCGAKDYFGIEIQKTCAQATAFDPWEHCEYEPHNEDPYAATRRAIVRAAAIRARGDVLTKLNQAAEDNGEEL